MKNKVLQSIAIIYEKSKYSKFNDSLFLELNEELTFLSDYFNVTKSQSLIIALTITIGFTQKFTDTNDLISHLECNPINILELNEEICGLFKLGFYENVKLSTGMFNTHGKFNFVISKKVIEAIIKERPIPILKKTSISVNIYEILEKIIDLSRERGK